MKHSNLYIFSFKIVLFLLAFFALDRFVAFQISESVISGQYDKRIDALMNGEIAPDVLIMGSSRSARNIMPSEMENGTSLDVYSLAYPGVNADFKESMLRLVIASGKIPSSIVMSVDDNFELLDKDAVTYRYDLLNPYSWYSPVSELLCEKGKMSCFFSRVSKAYAENMNFEDAISFSREGPEIPDPINIVREDGDMTIDGVSADFSNVVFEKSVAPYDKSLENPLLVEKFLSFVNICKANGIKLYIVFPPLFRADTPLFAERIKELASDYPTYIDLRGFIKDKQFFYDVHHLNKKGALILSKEIAILIADEKKIL